MRIGIIGPPVAGRASLVASLAARMPAPAGLLHVAPDANGHRGAQTDALGAVTVGPRDAGEWSGRYRGRSLLIDVDGRVQGPRNPELTVRFDGLLVVAPAAELASWERLAPALGCPVLAVVELATGGTAEWIDSNPLRARIVVGAENGLPVRGAYARSESARRPDPKAVDPPIDAIAHRLILAAAARDDVDERRADLSMGRLARDIGVPVDAWGRHDWLPEHLRAVAERVAALRGRGRVYVHGSAPDVVWAAVVGALEPATAMIHDPWRGYIEIPPIRAVGRGGSAVPWTVRESDDFTLVSWSVGEQPLSEHALIGLTPPAVRPAVGVCLHGDGPWWLAATVQRAYASAPWVARLAPRAAAVDVSPGHPWHWRNPGCLPFAIVRVATSSAQVGAIVAVPSRLLAAVGERRPGAPGSPGGAAAADRWPDSLPTALQAAARRSGLSESGLAVAWRDRLRVFETVAEVEGLIADLLQAVDGQSYGVHSGGARDWLGTFADELFVRLHTERPDPVGTAAWVEHELNCRAHLTTGAVGPLARVLAGWVLLRYHTSLPDWTSAAERERCLQDVAHDRIDDWLSTYRQRVAAGGRPPVAVIERRPGVDVAAAAWAFRRFACAHDMDPVFVDSLADEATWSPGRADLARMADQAKSRSGVGGGDGATRAVVELYAPVADRRLLEPLLCELEREVEVDEGRGALGAERRVGLGRLFEALRAGVRDDDARAWRGLSELLDGLLEVERDRALAAVEAERAEFPAGPEIAVVRDKSSRFTDGELFARGVRAVVYTDGPSVGVIRRVGESFHLGDLLAADLERREPGWFVDPTGRLVSRLPRPHAAAHAGSVRPEEIVQLLDGRI